jgi:tetratricopeptide (TPR) repeat protein
VPIAVPRKPAPPPPIEEDPSELAEAEFFIEQGLLDEADEAVAHLRSMVARRPGLRVKVERLESRLAQAHAPVEPDQHADDSFDLASELAEEVAKAGPAPVEEDFQYSVEDVLSDFKKELQKVLKPEDVEAHYDMGIAYKEMGLLDEATSEFEVALRGAEGKAKEPDCLSMIGICRAAKGDFPKALGAFERALRARLLKPEARLNLYFEIGAAKEASGDLVGALDAYEKVARVDPGYRQVSAALSRVRGPRVPGPNGSKGGPGTGGSNGSPADLSDGADEPDDPTLSGPIPTRPGKIGYV